MLFVLPGVVVVAVGGIAAIGPVHGAQGLRFALVAASVALPVPRPCVCAAL